MSDLNTNQDAQPLGIHPPERMQRIQLLRSLTLSTLILLIGLGLAWELKLAPLQGGTGALALKVLPPGMSRDPLIVQRFKNEGQAAAQLEGSKSFTKAVCDAARVPTAAYGHFGRNEPEFTWEATDRVQVLRDAAGLKG